MERIAEALNVSKMTISNDLVNCKAPLQSKPAKTASNPKGAGPDLA
jgi:transcriptional antiterminator